MDNLHYLYNLTLENYIDKVTIEDNPLYETLLIDFASKNISVLTDNKLIFNFISNLTFELDKLYLKKPKKDVLFFVNYLDKTRLRAEVKKLSKKIKEL
tara:strand:+ start:577 stop:870 length:294 start_codon:yes stop_codon:yes gene_type:complete